MRGIVFEILNVLRRVCCAESVGIEMWSEADGETISLFRGKSDTGCDRKGPGLFESRQIPFLLQECTGRSSISSKEGENTAEGKASVFLKSYLSCSTAAENWIAELYTERTWVFSRSENQVHLELTIRFFQGIEGSLCDLLQRVDPFLSLLEAVIPYSYSGTEMDLFDPVEGLHRSEKIPFDPPMFGLSRKIFILKEKVRKVASASVPVLIEGENGTGKEIVARNIHNAGRRRDKTLAVVNCLEMPPTLLQGELFGHARGSYTGAFEDRRGLLESAAGGTFFFDEIGEMPQHLQAALLRVIQEKEIRRIGENSTRSVDVRFIFATNRNLQEQVRQGRFRQDLYYRIKGVRLFVPALRERKDDILILASKFLESASRVEGKRTPGISKGAARCLIGYDWPGNVRELKNEMERVLTLYPDEELIKPAMLSPNVTSDRESFGVEVDEEDSTIPAAVQRLERRMIGEALMRFNGNRTRTAGVLGITRQGLLKKMKRFGMI